MKNEMQDVSIKVTITCGNKTLADCSVETKIDYLSGPHDLSIMVASVLTTKVRNWLILEIEKNRSENKKKDGI